MIPSDTIVPVPFEDTVIFVPEAISQSAAVFMTNFPTEFSVRVPPEDIAILPAD